MIAIGLALIFIFSEIMGQKEQLADLLIFSRLKQRNTRWKGWENFQKGIFFAALFAHTNVIHVPFFLWKDVLLALGISIAFFEIGTNTIGLHKHWLFVGASSKFDKLGKWKWVVVFGILFSTILIKIYV